MILCIVIVYALGMFVFHTTRMSLDLMALMIESLMAFVRNLN